MIGHDCCPCGGELELVPGSPGLAECEDCLALVVATEGDHDHIDLFATHWRFATPGENATFESAEAARVLARLESLDERALRKRCERELGYVPVPKREEWLLEAMVAVLHLHYTGAV